MTSKRNRKIRNLLINPSYQLKYTFFITFTGICLVTLLAFISYSYLRENYQTLIELSPMTDEARAQLIKELHDIAFYLGSASTTFLALVAIMGLWMSHRVAGPMYHFQRVFDEISQGNRKARVKLRPNDEFHDVAKVFNEMMDKL